MQDACHMNFVIDFAHYGVSVARWLEHQSVESEGPKVRRFDPSLTFLCTTLVTRRKKNIFLNIDNRIKIKIISKRPYMLFTSPMLETQYGTPSFLDQILEPAK